MRGFLLIVVLFFVGLVFLEVRGNKVARNLCDSHPVGSDLVSLENIDVPWSFTRLGPVEDPKHPGVTKVTFCTTHSMCDTSCVLEHENGKIISSEYYRY